MLLDLPLSLLIMADNLFAVYIMTNKGNTVLYTGVTRNLKKRVWEHKNHIDRKSFTARYNLEKLVYFEVTNEIRSAIEREKKIKAGSRRKKIDLIESTNPEWMDLYEEI